MAAPAPAGPVPLLARSHPDPAARAAHDLHGPAQCLLHPLLEAPLVGRIDPQVAQTGQRLGVIGDGCQQALAARAIGHLGRMDQRLDHEAGGVDQQVALAPLHLLTAVEPR